MNDKTYVILNEKSSYQSQSHRQKYDNYNMWNIRFFGFGKETSSLPVYGLTLEKQIEEQLKVEVPKVLGRLKDLQLNIEERQRIKSEFGAWFCKKDDKGFFFLALCVNNYPERHIYAAIQELRTHLATIGDYSSEPDSTLKLHSKGKLSEICEKYNNLKGLDKIGQANHMLNDIKEDVTESTRKLMNNQVNLEDLNRKASDLKEGAMMFETSAAQVQREMYCRNCKMKVIIAIVVVVLICVIVIPIATKK